MKDVSKTELIELVAAVSLRLSGFIYAIGAFRYLYQLSEYIGRHSESIRHFPDDNVIKSYIMDIAYDALIAMIMFLLTVPLARLLCRGVLPRLELKPSD